MLRNEIIIETKRNNIVEKAYVGAVIALDKNSSEILSFSYDKTQNIIFRSMQKPFQAFSFMLSGAYEKFKLTEKELAIIAGSHAGTFEQTEIIKGILKKAKLKISDLNCPKDYPLDVGTTTKLIKENKYKSPIYHNCSGKHAGMLCACRAYDFNIENYQNSNHPLQRKIISDTLKLCEYNTEISALDGCGVPVLAMPLEFMANGLQNLYKTEAGQKIIHSAIKYPMLFGGNNRFDTEIIKLTNGKVFAKVGAAGLVGALNLETQEVLVVKIFADDYGARKEVTLDYMSKLKWL